MVNLREEVLLVLLLSNLELSVYLAPPFLNFHNFKKLCKKRINFLIQVGLGMENVHYSPLTIH